MHIESRQHYTSLQRPCIISRQAASHEAGKTFVTIRSVSLILMLILLFVLSSSVNAFAIPVEELNKEAAQGVITSQSSSKKTIETEQSNNADSKETNKTKSYSAESDKFILGDYQDPSTQKESSNVFTSVVQSVFDVIKYIFYLLVVLAIGVAAIYGVKFFTAKYNNFSGGTFDLIHIIEIRYLAPGKAICLIEIAGKIMVVGFTGTMINLLGDINETEQVEFLTKTAKKTESAQQPFQGLLNKMSKSFSSVQAKQIKKSVRKSNLASNNASNDIGTWSEELSSTGDNIRRLLEDIKGQDYRSKQFSASSRDRGDE